MVLKSPRVYDLLAPDSDKGRELFLSELEAIRRDEFRLKQNYLNIDLNDYHSFTILCEGDDLVAFSGLQAVGPWGPDIARLSTRFYIAKKFRTQGGRSYFSGSRYLNPVQLDVASRLGLSDRKSVV